MDDLISRQAAIDAVKKHYRAHDNDLLELIAFDIERLPSAQSEPQWISCSERLPENYITVLVTHKGGVSSAWYNGRYWERGANQKHREIKTVKAWMPLPKPYIERREE